MYIVITAWSGTPIFLQPKAKNHKTLAVKLAFSTEYGRECTIGISFCYGTLAQVTSHC